MRPSPSAVCTLKSTHCYSATRSTARAERFMSVGALAKIVGWRLPRVAFGGSSIGMERPRTAIRAGVGKIIGANMESTLKESLTLMPPGKPNMAEDDYQPVTLEAHKLVFGDRNEQYGNPFDDFSITAEYLTTYLKSRELLAEGKQVIAEDVSPILSVVKLSRYANGINTGKPKRDTTVDKAGYAETEWRVIHERARRKS